MTLDSPASRSNLAQALASDPNSIAALRQTANTGSKAGVKAVAQQFEALLMQQMLKSMRDATPQYDTLSSSPASSMFRSMYDEQIAANMSAHGGVGLADAIVRQISIQQDPSLLKQAWHTPPNPFGKSSTLTGKAATAATGAAKDAGDGGNTASFIDKIGNAARSASATLGVSPHVLVAQAALETGWGKKPLTDASGQDTHNLFGVKAGKDWQGKTADVTTTEYVNGVPQKKTETFRAYDSYADAMSDYASIIKRRFSDAVGSGSDAKSYGTALQSKGYATDPYYAGKLAVVAARVQKQMAGSGNA
ncbi:flagellar assembly peptidoglycan hydrolase FlgJ [Silvimonas iriomotensis]|uniref:Peptidoglycan hydrolase FlgJ n=1 Tax=Silvimonas iriomotensis TaxID=449662 RepID=A0ABQ2P4U3_9NEIS|nr:flagellar assembly peptidoglycan hydrolase FlgJ [Silvimonas iriomotensis]GGP18268.1 flagellar rod assembly protein/muramidase FlgJ [Silvimonas iriomotensis]